VLKTSHFATQLRAAAAGLGVVLAAAAYQRVHTLVPLRTSRTLKPVFETLPEEELWLVGHRALREVPRIAALWEFLAQAFRDPAATPVGDPSRAERPTEVGRAFVREGAPFAARANSTPATATRRPSD
jgi:hypothetical protein